MQLVVLIVAIAVIFAMRFLSGKRKKKSSEKKFKNTDEFVQWLASEAVNDASQQNHVELDYSIESIQRVDDVLGGLHKQYVKNASSVVVNGLATTYGADLGEVIRSRNRVRNGNETIRSEAKSLTRSPGAAGIPIPWRGVTVALSTVLKTMCGLNTKR